MDVLLGSPDHLAQLEEHLLLIRRIVSEPAPPVRRRGWLLEQCRRRGDDVRHAFCRGCRAMWEPINPAILCDPDDPDSGLTRPCDNCAFRKGSPERLDPQKWEKLMMDIHRGGAVFYCHKGVPMAVDNDPDDQTHMHPKKPNGEYDARVRGLAEHAPARHLQVGRGEVSAYQRFSQGMADK